MLKRLIEVALPLKDFRNLVNEVLGRGEFKPKDGDGSTVEDTPRNRCLEFIKHLVKWENSNNPEYIEAARKHRSRNNCREFVAA